MTVSARGIWRRPAAGIGRRGPEGYRADTANRFKKDLGVVHLFVIAGTPDERDFHLRLLAAFIQVFRSKGFKELWMAATNDQGLRDAVLLSERVRGRKGECRR